MLKAIAFKNFVHFKNKTVIRFDDSMRRQSGNSNGDGRPNFLNIFVGANFSGKSAVLELIRRCMAENINTSVTKSVDENEVAYAFCKFQKGLDPVIISGIIKDIDPKTKEIYKVIFSSDKLDIILYSLLNERKVYKCQNSLDADIPIIFSDDDDDGKIYQILQKIKDLCQDKTELTVTVPEKSTESTWDLWDSITNKYVATFPLRGIGSIQWSKSKKINGQRDTNYTEAYNRAEILSASLSEEDEDKNFFAQVDVDEEKKIFKYLTDLDDFELDKNTGDVTVTPNKRTPFHLLKISEGIFEAKSTSLLLANKQLETLCLEEPERGMHPQMIERLRSVLYGIGFKKTIIVVTHSPYLIDNMTIDRTHVFFRTKNDPSVFSVLNIGQSEELSKVVDIEIKRTLLFATRVLLVEGATDREVVQGILTENEESKEDFTYISTHQIISVGGKDNAARVQRFCTCINLPCLCLLDLDAAVKFNIKPLKDFQGFDESFHKMYQDTLVRTKEELWQFLKKLESQLRVFIWRDGALEDAILSSESCNEEISSALGKERLNPDSLKTMLKEQMDGNKRKAFYTALMKVDEIKRFIKFIEDNTQTSKPTGAGVDI